jgi:hypothetical protein
MYGSSLLTRLFCFVLALPLAVGTDPTPGAFWAYSGAVAAAMLLLGTYAEVTTANGSGAPTCLCFHGVAEADRPRNPARPLALASLIAARF